MEIRIFFLIFYLIFFLAPKQCFAQIETLFGKIENVITFLFSLVAVIATLAIVVAGYQYLTSGGAADQMEKAKTNIFWILIGLAIIILARAIVILILKSVGGNPSAFGL
jgi:uncharacterized membrane protein